jgi:chemotaxis protein MotB
MARKKKHPEHVNHERWLVSYADFITLLFAFFTTLYAISTVDQKKAGKLMYSMRTAFNLDFFTGVPNPGTQLISIMENIGPSAPSKPAGHGAGAGGSKNAGKGASGKDKLSALAKKLGELSVDPRLKGKVQIRMEGRGLVVSLAEAGFFPSGSATMRPDSVEPLLALAETFQDPGFRVTVEGHTDNIPVKNAKFNSNWELSTARASTVVALLIEKAGVAPTRLSAAGYGEFKPVAPNDTNEGRSKNRRVDIVIAPQGAEVEVTPDVPENAAAEPAAPASPPPPAPASTAVPPGAPMPPPAAATPEMPTPPAAPAAK